MRSANGRHRRPRQAPALVVAAGVTGSAIAIPLLGATGASAADASTWDRVAECESGGMWSADLGNGYYGGLQISQETWDDFGGTAYAPTADRASRSQQIAVAEKVLVAQGPTAWPTCALITGLTAEGGVTPSRDGEPSGSAAEEPEPSETAILPAAPESTPASGQFGRDTAPDGDSASRSPSAETDATSDADAGTGAGADASSGTGGTGGSDTGGSDTGGKHRGEPAPESGATDTPGAADGSAGASKPGSSDEERESGRHASRGDGPTRDGEADGATGAGSEGDYTVRSGDNLWAIADEHEVPGGWPALYEANRGAVGDDADLILPGQSLDLSLNQG